MIRGHGTEGRRPERSATISGNERSGLTPISAEVSSVPSDLRPAPKPKSKGLIGVLQLLKQRQER
jgi:hypothetical protein